MRLDLDIHNYYEHLVTEYLCEQPSYADYDTDLLSDICCLALSKLPARYIRHNIDMAFYLNSTQRSNMLKEAQVAVDESRDFLLDKLNLKQSQKS